VSRPQETRLILARQVAGNVADPEIPVLTLDDLGVIRDVALGDNGVEVTITPTYSGCPAMRIIELDIETALVKAGFDMVSVKTVLSPAWTTDWMTEAGRGKLKDYGVAPPASNTGRRALFGDDKVCCPQCGSEQTEEISAFGSTACKSLRRCMVCREPFDYFKCH
jgi:ring-1,2-phenylacetyl-CoA epoxidase subunit PaaD